MSQNRNFWTRASALEVLADDIGGADGGNSHTPMLQTYDWMVVVFTPIWRSIVSGRVGTGGR